MFVFVGNHSRRIRVILLLLFFDSADCLVISSDRETVKSLESADDRKEIDTAVDSPGNLAIPWMIDSDSTVFITS